jgi:ribonuclease E
VIIEPTEALTVIDVNSGSFTRSANARETVLWTNCEAAVEIARQLKLRNIGGVVIIDFIDMESRRDQLQLLEHFTQAVRDDAARPQIAQLTELGLVELTRKRQGQNIYELFGRACPSCGGLGHVAVLPGQDSLQPLATATGLVRSAASARAEVLAPGAAAETGSGRRRRGGRGGRAAAPVPVSSDLADSGVLMPIAPLLDGHDLVSGEPAGFNGASDSPAASRRPEPELVAVPMDADQEAVYGWLGLNPTLLLDEPPAAENVVVRVVRPDADADAVLEAARQQLASSGSRRRRGRSGRGGGGGAAPSGMANGSSAPRDADFQESETQEERRPATVEITPLPLQLEPETIVTVSVPTRVQAESEPQPLVAATTAAIEQEEDGQPRRRRRRSSAAS